MTSLFSKDDRILVTGASSGLGKALAHRLYDDGATVIANGRDIGRLEELKSNVKDAERLILAPRDLLEDPDSLPLWIRRLAKQYGPLYGLACCAGMDTLAPLAMIDASNWIEHFRLNWLAPVLLARGFVDKRTNSGRGSAVLFIASIAAHLPLKGQIIYSSTKAALIAAMKNIAIEIGSRGIRANSISPGLVASPMNQTGIVALTKMENTEARLTSLGPGTPQDIAALGSFLLSADARWITGQDYVIDGGRWECKM